MAYRPDDDVPPVVRLEPFGPEHDADSLLVGESDRHSAVEVVALPGEEVGRRTLSEEGFIKFHTNSIFLHVAKTTRGLV